MLNAVTEERIRVRYGETDQMGHAYYAHYLFWFEQARGAWCRARGFTYKMLEDMGYFLPVLEVRARYKGEVKYDDLIVVRIKMTAIKRNAIRYDYEIVNAETGKTVTEGHTWHLLVTKDMANAGIPKEVMDLLQRDPAQFVRLE